MAYTTWKLVLLATLLALASTTTFSTAEDGLAARLKLATASGESSSCWDSLVELQACTGEVILFFLNGETYLGPSCCRAIRIIGRLCWPAMFGSLGFTAEEADLLQGFCDGLEPPPPPPLPPSQQPSAQVVFVEN